MYKFTTALAFKPISVLDAKAHMRIDHDDDNLYIDSLIDVATDFIFGAQGHTDYMLSASVEQSVKTNSYSNVVENLKQPFIELTELKIRNGAELEVIEGAYFTHDGLKLPASGEYIIKYTAGYASAAAIPPNLKAACKILVAHWYQYREPLIVAQKYAANQLPFSIMALLQPYRKNLVM